MATLFICPEYCHLCLKKGISGVTTGLLTKFNKFLSLKVGTLTCVIRTFTNLGNESEVLGLGFGFGWQLSTAISLHQD